MIVILCKSYKEACRAYEFFIEFLLDNEPWAIRKQFEHENCVETDDDLRYIFVDRRVEKVFEKMRPDIVEVQQFFEGINEFYYCDHIIDYYDL